MIVQKLLTSDKNYVNTFVFTYSMQWEVYFFGASRNFEPVLPEIIICQNFEPVLPEILNLWIRQNFWHLCEVSEIAWHGTQNINNARAWQTCRIRKSKFRRSLGRLSSQAKKNHITYTPVYTWRHNPHS